MAVADVKIFKEEISKKNKFWSADLKLGMTFFINNNISIK